MFRKTTVTSEKILTLNSLRWVLKHKAYSPWYLIRYYRYFCLRLKNPHIVFKGMVFLGKKVEIVCDKNLGYLEFGKWVHIGEGNAIRCHEGVIKIGDKTVFGRNNIIDAYLNIEIGACNLIADSCFFYDYNHVIENPAIPIKNQGINKGPIVVGDDCWFGAKTTVLKDTKIGSGSVLGANALVKGIFPDFSVAAGVPAKLIKNRKVEWDNSTETRAELAKNLEDIARKKLL